MKVDIELLTIGRIGILILWVATAFGFFFLFTIPNSTEFVVRYAITFTITTFMTILDWFIVSEAMGLKPDDPVGESFNSLSDEVSPRHWVRAALGEYAQYGVLIAVAVGFIWSGYYAYGILVRGQEFLAVPDLYTSVVLSSSPIPFISTGTWVAFVEAWNVSLSEESLFIGLVFMTLWSVALVILSKVTNLRENKGAYVAVAVILMFIMAIPAAWMNASGQHFFAYQKNKFAYEKAYNHFYLAAVIDGSVGSILPSVMAHFSNNFLLKNAKYNQRFSAIPVDGSQYTVGTPIRVG